MISEFSIEQKDLYDCVRRDWKNRSCCRNNDEYENSCLIVLENLFKFRELPCPEIIILDSPLACLMTQITLKKLAGKESINKSKIRRSMQEVWKNIMLTNQCFSIAYDFDSQEDVILDKVYNMLNKNIKCLQTDIIQSDGGNFFEYIFHQRNIDNVKKKISHSIWEEYFFESPVFNGDFMLSSLNLYVDFRGKSYPWTYDSLIFYDFVTRLQIINDPLFNGVKEMLLNDVFDIIYLENVCLISKLPHLVTRNEEGRLHSYNGDPAIEFMDGYQLYFENGKRISKWDTYANLF
ncbi:MAG: hypothetical protein J0H85_06795 [Sediminibacterium magnilacihabitans]|jgi:hypothetical protein|nr:hypothetical protein [Sediminibacterium magnilacihabitans]PQV61013.1 hypothetical protein CLV53_104109 [Sediminibacterium magnilacihabitans]